MKIHALNKETRIRADFELEISGENSYMITTPDGQKYYLLEDEVKIATGLIDSNDFIKKFSEYIFSSVKDATK